MRDKTFFFINLSDSFGFNALELVFKVSESLFYIKLEIRVPELEGVLNVFPTS